METSISLSNLMLLRIIFPEINYTHRGLSMNTRQEKFCFGILEFLKTITFSCFLVKFSDNYIKTVICNYLVLIPCQVLSLNCNFPLVQPAAKEISSLEKKNWFKAGWHCAKVAIWINSHSTNSPSFSGWQVFIKPRLEPCLKYYAFKCALECRVVMTKKKKKKAF